MLEVLIHYSPSNYNGGSQVNRSSTSCGYPGVCDGGGRLDNQNLPGHGYWNMSTSGSPTASIGVKRWSFMLGLPSQRHSSSSSSTLSIHKFFLVSSNFFMKKKPFNIYEQFIYQTIFVVFHLIYIIHFFILKSMSTDQDCQRRVYVMLIPRTKPPYWLFRNTARPIYLLHNLCHFVCLFPLLWNFSLQAKHTNFNL